MIAAEWVAIAVILGWVGWLIWGWLQLNKQRKKRAINQSLARQYSHGYVEVMERAYRKRQELLKKPGVKEVKAYLEGRDLVIVVTKGSER